MSNRLTLLNEFDKCQKEIMVAQWLGHWVLVLEVMGSIPVLATLFHAPLASLAEIMSMQCTVFWIVKLTKQPLFRLKIQLLNKN